jgi:hypothetical protein
MARQCVRGLFEPGERFRKRRVAILPKLQAKKAARALASIGASVACDIGARFFVDWGLGKMKPSV